MIPVIPGSTKEDEAIPRLPMPSRNPLPLSAAQESQVRELYHARVRGYCAKEIKGEVLLWWQVMIWEPRVFLVLERRLQHQWIAVLTYLRRLRRLRAWPHLLLAFRLPRTKPSHELMHDQACNTRRARPRTRGVVRPAIATPS
jgi:COX assembly protein 1